MKQLKTILALGGVAASLAFVTSFTQEPVETGAFSTIHSGLGTAQRDFRVFNNFTDTQANNNTTAHVNFPGHTGAVMAIWKGHVEWASEVWAGNGQGDSQQTSLGDGGANFDNTFQGLAVSSGSSSQNIHSELAGSSGSTLAFMQGGSSGWWIRYYATWTWQDGPGNVTSGVDLQGVACHESGHAIGLGHSGTSGATMFPSISGTGVGQRSIATDDINGVQAVYGVKSGTKPRITGISGTKNIGDPLTITGQNFATTNTNEIWFTAVNSNGTAAKVFNVGSTGGGTQIVVTIPGGVVDGDVLVRNSNISGGAGLSNAWPIDIGGGGGGGDPPTLTTFNPALGPMGGWTSVTITGSGFNGTTAVRFGGVDAKSFTVDSPTQITAVTPGGSLAQGVILEVQDPDGFAQSLSQFVYTFNPAINITGISPSTGPAVGGTEVTISGASLVGATGATFGGVAGTDFIVTSATTADVVTPAGAGAANVVVSNGTSTGTLVGGFVYQSSGGAFVILGPGIAGIFGEPILTGTGDLTPGSLTGYSTTISNAIPFNNGYLFLSLTQGAAPLKGGTLYPFPIMAQFVLPMSGTGTLTLPHIIPAGQGLDGLSITAQWWFADVSAIQGASASNGLRLDIP